MTSAGLCTHLPVVVGATGRTRCTVVAVTVEATQATGAIGPLVSAGSQVTDLLDGTSTLTASRRTLVTVAFA